MTGKQNNTVGTRRNETDYSMIPKEGEVIELPPREEEFLRYYMQNAETRYNGTWSYNYAYQKGLDKLEPTIEITDEKGKVSTIPNPEYERVRKVCSTLASRLLVKSGVNKKKIILANENLNNITVDSELSGVITQNKDLSAKNKAISEYNKLNQRIVDRVDLRSTSIGVVKHVYEQADTGTTKAIDGNDDVKDIKDNGE